MFYVDLTLVRKEVEKDRYILHWEGTDNSGSLITQQEVMDDDCGDDGSWPIGSTRTMHWGDE